MDVPASVEVHSHSDDKPIEESSKLSGSIQPKFNYWLHWLDLQCYNATTLWTFEDSKGNGHLPAARAKI